jgi:hypothetical protein
MTRNNSLAAALWLLAAAAAFAAGPTWAGSMQNGMMSPWALVAFFWGAAALSVSIHYLAHYLAQAAHTLKRHWSGHRAAAAQPAGVGLGG